VREPPFPRARAWLKLRTAACAIASLDFFWNGGDRAMNALSIARWLVRGGWAGLLASLILMPLCANVFAQTGRKDREPARTYKEDRPRDVSTTEQTNARMMLRAGMVSDKNLFDTVYQWRCAQLTWTSKLNDTSDLRRRLASDLRAAERAEKPDAFERLTALVLKSTTAIVQDRGYHPTSRLNAMLLLGDLNIRAINGNATRLVPHPDALPHLLGFAQVPAAEVTGADDAIRCAALHGLVRHGKAAGKDAAERQSVLKATIAIASNDSVPQGRSEEVHEWIRRRALTVLETSLRPDAGELDEQAAVLLRALVANRSEMLRLRLEAARVLGSTQKQRERNALAATELAQSLGGLTIDLLNSEVVEVGGGGMMMRSEASREILAHGLRKISLALRTVESAPGGNATISGSGDSNPNDPSAVQYLRSRLAMMRKGLGDVQANDVAIARGSILLAGDLNAWLDSQAVAQKTDAIPEMREEQP
jgi:hypothetical protein